MENKQTILVVTDNRNSEALDFIDDLKINDLKAAHRATDDEKAMALFDKFEPQLLLISYENLEGAERFYLGLYKNSEKVHVVPHQTILLCKAQEAHTAYELCDKGIFDDYVIYKPPYDSNRLRLSVRQALARIEIEAGAMNTKLSRFGKVTDNLGGVISEAINQGNKVKAQSQQAYTNIEGEIEKEFDDFSKSLSDEKKNNVAGYGDVSHLEKRLARFRKERLQPKLKKVNTDINQSMEKWTGDVESEYRKHETSINDLNEIISAIPKSILIVDDDDMYSRILQKTLESEGYKVSRANDGIKGLGMIARTKPDLVLLDYEMPGFNGIEVIKKLKDNNFLKNIPVFMLTGLSDKKTVGDAIKLGALDYIVKPVERAVLVEKISSHFD